GAVPPDIQSRGSPQPCWFASHHLLPRPCFAIRAPAMRPFRPLLRRKYSIVYKKGTARATWRIHTHKIDRNELILSSPCYENSKKSPATSPLTKSIWP